MGYMDKGKKESFGIELSPVDCTDVVIEGSKSSYDSCLLFDSSYFVFPSSLDPGVSRLRSMGGTKRRVSEENTRTQSTERGVTDGHR